jgi:S-adenosylmethionine:tRNA ribosyltransferase-isomerase
MKTSLFNYDLPRDRIAQKPVRPRDRSRLLVLDRNTGGTEHRRFFEIGGLLKPGDILVVNDTKVFNARLKGRLSAGGRTVEVFLLRPDPNRDWIALAKPGGKLAQGSVIAFQNGVSCIIREKRTDGTVIASFNRTPDELIRWTEEAGAVPIPPYVKRVPSRADDYQTVYAKHAGSAAAPTAGFHFTPELMEKLKTNGVRFAPLTLHAGLGTFRPVQSDTIEEHEMHEEWISIPKKRKKPSAPPNGTADA